MRFSLILSFLSKFVKGTHYFYLPHRISPYAVYHSLIQEGATALIVATQYGRSDTVRHLVAYVGTNIDQVDNVSLNDGY